MSDPGSKRLHPALLAAVAIYLVSRALVLYTSFDHVAIPAYELFMNGSIARDLVGPVTSEVPLLFYYDNAMGPVLASYLVVPFYHLFGPTYLAFKLVSFVSLFPAIFLIWAFLRKHFGTRAAAIGALLFALPPTTSFKYTLVPMGNHAENVTLTMLALWGFFRVHGSGRRGLALFLAGLYAGVALMIFLGALIPVAMLFACHVGLVGWRRSLREVPVVLAGFVLGLVPLILANTLLAGASGLDFLLAKFGLGGGASAERGFDIGTFLERLGDFFVVHLPQAGTFPDFLGLPGAVAEYVFLGCFVVAYAVLLPDAARGAVELVRGALGAGADASEGAVGRAVLVPLVLLLPLTAIAFALADFRMADHAWPERFAGFRYFLPHFLFAILMIAIAAERLRRLRVALPGAALFAGLFSLALIDWSGSTPNLGAHYDGYNMQQNARLLLLPKNGPPELPERIRLSDTFPKPFRERIYAGHGYNELFVHTFIDRASLADFDLQALLASYPRAHSADVARGVGMRLRHAQREAGRIDDESWELLKRLSREPHGQQVAEGLCTWWSPVLEFRQAAHVEENMRLIHASHATKLPAVAQAVARGYGWDSGHYLRRGIASEEERIVASLERMPPSSVAPFYFGLGMGLVDGAEVEAIPAGLEAWVPEDHAGALLDGFQARLVEMYGAEEAVRRYAKVEKPEGWIGH